MPVEPPQLAGRRVTVMGLGRFGGGVGVARWLAEQGARVLVTDLAPREQLRDSVAALEGLDVAWRLGEHLEEDFSKTDLIIANPGVKPTSPYLRAARDAGVPITTEINLFVQHCSATIVGITGTVGKSTVAAMTHHVLTRTLAGRRVFLGGNIGVSLLDKLGELQSGDVVVLELSSFQLHHTAAIRWSPPVAVITNITPNHLDWHGAFNHYLASKLNVIRFQTPGRDRIVMRDDPELRNLFEEMFGDYAGIWRYGAPQDSGGCYARLQSISANEYDDRRIEWDCVPLQPPGRHNRENAAAALATALVFDVDQAAAASGLSDFEALPHRLQCVGRRDGVTYYDDSKASTPEAALTAIAAFDKDQALLLIVGGYDKGIDLSELAARAATRAKHVACIGATGTKLREQVHAAGGAARLYGSLAEAVAGCRDAASKGDVVLLSPGCASWDMFTDYQQRGREFQRLALTA